MNHIWGLSEQDIYDEVWFNISPNNRTGIFNTLDRVVRRNVYTVIYWDIYDRISKDIA